jgi:hypothetical protein
MPFHDPASEAQGMAARLESRSGERDRRRSRMADANSIFVLSYSSAAHKIATVMGLEDTA